MLACCLLGVRVSSVFSGVSATLVFPSDFLLLTLLAGVSGHRILCVLPGVLTGLLPWYLRALEGVVTDTFLRGDLPLSGVLPDPSKLRFRFTICFVFLGDLAPSSFFFPLIFNLEETIRPVVTSLVLLLSLLVAAERSICREVRLVSKLFGRLRNDLERFALLGLLTTTAGAGGCMELAEEGPSELLDFTLFGWTDLTGEHR